MSGIEMIAAERKRQIEDEGWTPEHDDKHTRTELKQAAIHYLGGLNRDGKLPWPWFDKGEFPHSHGPLRDLTRAGALIAAEIDRLLRAEDRNR